MRHAAQVLHSYETMQCPTIELAKHCLIKIQLQCPHEARCSSFKFMLKYPVSHYRISQTLPNQKFLQQMST